MRFRLTIFLLIANVALFWAMWSLERDPAAAAAAPETAPFTVLEISGKGIDKPRVLKFENNKWRITAPIDWPANLFAVNRIRNQIEFLDREASFSLSEVTKHGHTLAEYGLDDPAYTFRYGNGKKMYTLKIGKSAPVGNRIYMLDEGGDRIIVVDREFVESLVVDTERLRNQNVFDIPRFEVSAFSVRLPSAESADSLKGNFRRIGLVRDGGKWKFETPIVAAADSNEVDAFLTEICQLSAKSFSNDTAAEAGFEVSALPTTITLEGTNRRQVLLIGGKTKDGSQVYARLEDNPTIFTIDASAVANLANVQTDLRDKSVMRFDLNTVKSLEISKGGKTLRFGKLKGGVWDVIGEDKNGASITSKADSAALASLLLKLSKIRVRKFVSDAPGENVAPYGFTPNSLKITATDSDGTVSALDVGGFFGSGNERLVYAKTGNSDAIFGIPRDIVKLADTDFMKFRSKIVEILPENAVITSLKISDIAAKKTLFEISSKNGDFNAQTAQLGARKKSALQNVLKYAKLFSVKGYPDCPFDAAGISPNGGRIPWVYSMEIRYEVRGSGANVVESGSWLFSKRLGGTTQYGAYGKTAFATADDFIDSFFEFTSGALAESELKKTPPAAPDKKAESEGK